MYGNLAGVSLDCGPSGYVIKQISINIYSRTNASQTNIHEIDSIIIDLVNDDVQQRPTARQALNMLSDVVNSTPPRNLLIAPSVWENGVAR